MPLALLLTPDDQAVGAITSVLEEMGVTWERPRDGASAATRLHSGNVDLVLVDCENLQAAKLILDVCRRTKTGRTLVGIAIADGRTELPTAFRLGAEFVLTRPVAKDQARTTVRAALNRSKKAASSGGAVPENTSDQVAQANRNLLDSSSATQTSASTDHIPNEESGDSPAAPKTMTAAAAAESPWREIRYTASSDATTMSAAAHGVSEAAIGRGTLEPGMATAIDVVDSGRDSLAKDAHSDDLVLAEIERTERESKAGLPNSAALGDIEEKGHEKKGSGLLVALLVFAQLCSGFYAAWITQPKFRAFLQPQIERVRTLIGIGNVAQSSTGSLTHGSAVRQPAPAPAQFKPTNDAASAGHMATNARSIAAAAEKTTPKVASPPSSTGTIQSPGISTPNLKANSGGPSAKMSGNDGRITAQTAIAQASGTRPNDPVHPTTAPDPTSEIGVVLSSQGAEKRLISSVPPQYQPSMRSEGAVLLRVSVDADGKVASAQVVGDRSEFSSAAVTAVRQWRYRPYIRDGEAVPFETIVQVTPTQPEPAQ